MQILKFPAYSANQTWPGSQHLHSKNPACNPHADLGLRTMMSSYVSVLTLLRQVLKTCGLWFLFFKVTQKGPGSDILALVYSTENQW